MAVKHFHHVAYRCTDAKQTVAFYQDILGLKYRIGVAENEVPSTKEFSPHVHVFLDVGDGSFLAFFELPESPPMGHDGNTPRWVQHIALQVEGEEDLERYRRRLVDAGISVVGPTDHNLFKSIYFFDPSGHRLELTYTKASPELLAHMENTADELLQEWAQTKRAPQIGSYRELGR